LNIIRPTVVSNYDSEVTVMWLGHSRGTPNVRYSSLIQQTGYFETFPSRPPSWQANGVMVLKILRKFSFHIKCRILFS